MTKRLPEFSERERICIICEGDEEYDYLSRLIELQVWNSRYEVSLENAGGNGNIPARYQDRFQNGAYNLVLVFCDTEKKPHEQYLDIKNKINAFHGMDSAADEVVIFGNPCTLQIILSHWGDEILRTPGKKTNAPLVEKYTGIRDYKAGKEQRGAVCKLINAENYVEMKHRISRLADNDEVTGSTNIGRMLERLESDDASWIGEINKML